MVRKAVNSSVAEVDVDFTRPVDSAGQNDQARSNADSTSISGSGASDVTAVTNNSDGNWYLESVTCHALGNGNFGNLQIIVSIENSAGTTKLEKVGDVLNGQISFPGSILKPGWSVVYEINQNDANSYDVVVKPLFRKPDPDNTTDNAPTTETTVVDGFEDNDIGEYTGDTGSFTVTDSLAYRDSFSLKANSGNLREIVTSNSGLPRYIPKGTKWSYYIRTSSVGDANPLHANFRFGAKDKTNGYNIIVKWNQKNEWFLGKIDGGTRTDLVFEQTTQDFKPDTWYRVEATWDDGSINGTDNEIRAAIYEAGSDTAIGNLSTTDATFAGETGIGFEARTDATGENVYFDHIEVQE